MKTTSTENRSIQWHKERIEYLSGFVSERRFETFKQAISQRTTQMTVLTENMFHPQNASALVRHCEAFGLQQMHTVEELCPFDPSLNIVKGTDKWVDIQRHGSTAEALAALRKEGYRIVATTPHREDSTPEQFDVTKGKFVLVFGTEHDGISQEVIDNSDEFLRIPMCGMVESLNVSASAAILLYMLSGRLHQQAPSQWQLSEEEQTELLYRWLHSSVKDADKILERKFDNENE